MSRAVVVMGPAGNGKSSLGRALADALGWPFIEGDACHPAANIAKMARGEPLDDADRAPFLDNVGRALAGHPQGAVAACSALKRAYRDRLRALAGDIAFVLPDVSRAELLRRLSSRPGHFMPPSLLDSQLADLEAPGADEHCLRVDGRLGLEAQAADLTKRLRGVGAPA